MNYLASFYDSYLTYLTYFGLIIADRIHMERLFCIGYFRLYLFEEALLTKIGLIRPILYMLYLFVFYEFFVCFFGFFESSKAKKTKKLKK